MHASLGPMTPREIEYWEMWRRWRELTKYRKKWPDRYFSPSSPMPRKSPKGEFRKRQYRSTGMQKYFKDRNYFHESEGIF